MGNTGLSSGPHLHFGLYRNNVAINPASVVKIAKNTLSGKELKDFLAYADTLRRKANAALNQKQAIVVEDNFSYVHPLDKVIQQ